MGANRNGRDGGDREHPGAGTHLGSGHVNGSDSEPAPSLASLAAEAPPAPSHIGARLRNYFLTGLIIAGPLTITLYIVWWVINFVDAWVKPLMPDFMAWLDRLWPGALPQLPEVAIPGVGLVFAIIGLTCIGALAANLLGQTIVSYGEMAMSRMPIVRGVYGSLKQIFETVFSQGNNSFSQVALVEFPRKGMWSIVFVAGEAGGEVAEKVGDGEAMIAAFLPCAPNPTTGYLIYVPRREVVMLDMKIDEAAKLVVSAGLLAPESASQSVMRTPPTSSRPPLPPGYVQTS
jgi:uncharacterized membrane protein